ncbi:MAG: hypothetical protein KC561_11250 [Myxococcales bacterium]|nr:hypothetical protein [Myxococcales bacterium]
MTKLSLHLGPITLTAATAALAATGCTIEPAESCQWGTEVSGQYCVYESAIIEDGFTCPPEARFPYEMDAFLVCSPDGRMSPDEIDDVLADPRLETANRDDRSEGGGGGPGGVPSDREPNGGGDADLFGPNPVPASMQGFDCTGPTMLAFGTDRRTASIYLDNYSLDDVDIITPEEGRNNPLAGEASYVYLEAGQAVVIDTELPLAGRDSLAQQLFSETFALQPYGPSEVFAEGMELIISDELQLHVLGQDYEYEVCLVRADLVESSQQLDVRLYFLANPAWAGVAHDLRTDWDYQYDGQAIAVDTQELGTIEVR